jgi:hypothetical protein
MPWLGLTVFGKRELNVRSFIDDLRKAEDYSVAAIM